MDILATPHKNFLIDLLKSKVRFMLIGGYAVNFHGYPRYTQDLDIWLQPEERNKINFQNFILLKGFNAESVRMIQELNFSKTHSFHFGEGESRIDFLTRITGVSFEEAEIQAASLDLDGYSIPVIQYNHLIISKISSPRLKDQADVEELQKIQKKRNKS